MTSHLQVNSELIARVDGFGGCFHQARMGALAALPGNPFGVEIRPFGSRGGVAVKVRHPLLRGKNRVYGFGPDNVTLLGDLLALYRVDGLRCTLHLPPDQMTQSLFRDLAGAGLWSRGSGMVPALVPGDPVNAAAPGISVRRSELGEKEQYLDVFQEAFVGREEQEPEYRAFQWAEDSLPGGARYVAEIAGEPVGMASFPVIGGVGYFGTAGVLLKHRGRGVQGALIRRRIADAPALGCDLILGGSRPDTPEFRNFERAGLRLVPSGSLWVDGAV